MLNPAQVFGQLNAQAQQALFKLNAALVSNGLPMYYQGGASFNTSYRLYPTPRYLLQWLPPWLRLEQIYLSYLPGGPGQVDIVYTVSSDSINLVRHG